MSAESVWIIEFRTRDKLAVHWQREQFLFESEKDAEEAVKFRIATWKSKEHCAVEYRRVAR